MGDGDGDTDAGEDAAVALPATLTEVVAKATPLSADQADRFWATTFGTDGKITSVVGLWK